MYTASVIRERIFPTITITKIWWVVVLIILWNKNFCLAGVGNTKHNLYHQDTEKNCSLCHTPHTGKSSQAEWIPEEKLENKAIFFTMPINKNVLCLSCHDGVLAKDIYMVPYQETEDDSALLSLPLDKLYYRISKLSLSTCEKHCYIIRFYQNRLPIKHLECSLCHDIHRLKSPQIAYLINKDTFYKNKICLSCHWFDE